MDDTCKYRAFISYSHADEKWAGWLHKALETYRIPKHLVAARPRSARSRSGCRRCSAIARAPDRHQSRGDPDPRPAAILGPGRDLLAGRGALALVNEEILTFKRSGASTASSP